MSFLAVEPASGRILPNDDPITADLRAFALEKGVPGWSCLTKDELVESLRQIVERDGLFERDSVAIQAASARDHSPAGPQMVDRTTMRR